MNVTASFSLVFIAVVSGSIYYFSLDNRWLLVYPILSLLTFAFYGFDKRAAINGRQRIAERTLHGLSLVGGWPGALLAQQICRHKSQKQPFKAILWLTILLNISVCIWFFGVAVNR